LAFSTSMSTSMRGKLRWPLACTSRPATVMLSKKAGCANAARSSCSSTACVRYSDGRRQRGDREHVALILARLELARDTALEPPDRDNHHDDRGHGHAPRLSIQRRPPV
jgi:hypothetical protein